MKQNAYFYFSDINKILSQNKEKNPLIFTIDPGLKGAIVCYWYNKKKLWHTEMPILKKIRFYDGSSKEKHLVDLWKVIDWIDEKLILTSTEEIFVVLEKPIKLGMSPLRTYTTSVIEVGKFLALFETHFMHLKKSLLFVAPNAWSSGFQDRISTGQPYHRDVKRNRLEILCHEFDFDRGLFFTPQGRFKDGVCDAYAMLMWFLSLGCLTNCVVL